MKVFFGSLASIALLVAIGVGLFGAFAGSAPVNFNPQLREAGVSPGESVQASPAPGEILRAGDVSWQVTDIRQRAEISTYTFPPETREGDFLTVTFTVKNTSERPVTLSQDTMALVYANGQETPALAEFNPGYIEEEKNLLFNVNGRLEPGEVKEGRVNFDLAAPFSAADPGEPASVRLQLGDTDPTVDEEAFVDLEVPQLQNS